MRIFLKFGCNQAGSFPFYFMLKSTSGSSFIVNTQIRELNRSSDLTKMPKTILLIYSFCADGDTVKGSRKNNSVPFELGLCCQSSVFKVKNKL